MNHVLIKMGVIILVSLLLTGTGMAVEPSIISPDLKQSENSKPYDDASFQERASFAIYKLTDPLPAGNNLMDLKSIYYEIVKKNISPEFYSQAKNVVTYLFYVMAAAEETQDYNNHISTGGNNVKFYDDIREQAYLDMSEAKKIWPNISAQYPNATVVSTD